MPEALNNYLLRLGWGHKDKEFFSVNEAINLFNIEGIGKSPSKFDKIKFLISKLILVFFGNVSNLGF